MFIVTVFTISEISNQTRCPSMGEWRKYGIYTQQNPICHKTEWDLVIYHRDITGGHYVKWDMPGAEFQELHALSHIQKLKRKTPWM